MPTSVNTISTERLKKSCSSLKQWKSRHLPPTKLITGDLHLRRWTAPGWQQLTEFDSTPPHQLHAHTMPTACTHHCLHACIMNMDSTELLLLHYSSVSRASAQTAPCTEMVLAQSQHAAPRFSWRMCLRRMPQATALWGTSNCSQWATKLVAATPAVRSLHNVDWNMIHDKKSVDKKRQRRVHQLNQS